MKVKILQPIKGYAYFEGDVANIPDKDAKELIEQKKAKPVTPDKDAKEPKEPKASEPAKNKK